MDTHRDRYLQAAFCIRRQEHTLRKHGWNFSAGIFHCNFRSESQLLSYYWDMVQDLMSMLGREDYQLPIFRLRL